MAGNLVLAEICGDEARVCGETCYFSASGARQGPISGGRSVEIGIDLAASAYTAGGFEFDPVICTTLGSITMLDQLGGTDPLCNKITPCGVQAVLDCDDPCKPRIQLFGLDGEVPDGFTADCVLWVRVYGC